MSSFFVWAHRGASAVAPENTLAAFAEAEAGGAEGIEIDVHLSRDGVPVVIHDETLKRTTDGVGWVSDFSVAELQRLDAGAWFASEFAGETIPTLEEILEWAGSRLRVNIEIKTADAALAVVELLRSFPRSDVLLSSFDSDLLSFLRREEVSLPLGFLCDRRSWTRVLKQAVASRAESFHPRRNLVNRPMIAACRREGLAVYPWTVDNPGDVRRFCRLGTDGLFTNDPRGVRKVLRRLVPATQF
ncbi:MAG: glycerophosphodiester phosphodiesterase [Desulfuromonadales bacterium]|nr:glycerophosphodiester phosphodiesterase [Desulfuromonadales bacterium]NIR34419.1 glycerophosphodiester phosphodiesterase [Desulfuromonadales bacterium]NIS44427.1 glycerophosphodiester phosphodiesterase [Desulfuromonadales bacterium]